MLLVVELGNVDVGRRIRRLQGVCRNVVLVAGEEGEREGGPQGGGSREEKARVLYMSVATQEAEGATHRLALFEQARPAGSDGEGPNDADTFFAGALLPYALAWGQRIKLIAELTSPGPSQLPHAQLGEAWERLRGLGTHCVAGRGPQRLGL